MRGDTETLWIVAAFESSDFKYYASILYDDKSAADAYCEKCNAECSKRTGKTYRTMKFSLQDEKNLHNRENPNRRNRCSRD